jgi:hypothetical protein
MPTIGVTIPSGRIGQYRQVIGGGLAPVPSNPTAPTKIPQSQAATLQRAVQWTFSLVIPTGATGVPQLVPGRYVPGNCSVWVYAKNGTTAGNTKVIFVADRPNALVNAPNSQSTSLLPGDEMPFPVDNTGQIWVAGTAGDGVVVQVINNPQS